MINFLNELLINEEQPWLTVLICMNLIEHCWTADLQFVSAAVELGCILNRCERPQMFLSISPYSLHNMDLDLSFLPFQVHLTRPEKPRPGPASEGFTPSGTFHPLGRSCVYFQGVLSFPGLSWLQSEGSWLRSTLHKGPGHSSCLPLIQCVSSR